jgi:hypothetical protein
LRAIVFIVLFCAANSAVAETVVVPLQKPAPVTCEQQLSVIKNETGKITAIKYKIKSEDDLKEEAANLIRTLTEKFAANPVSNSRWIQYEHFAPLSTTALELVPQIAKSVPRPKDSNGYSLMQKIETLLYGTNSLSAQIGHLENIISSKSLFSGKEARKKKIQESADTIKRCRAAVAVCKVELPGIMKDLNDDYAVLNASKNILAQELKLISHIDQLAKETFDPEEAARTTGALSKKSLELQSGFGIVEVLMNETDKMIAALEKVLGDSEAVGEGRLQKAVIKAAEQSIDIRSVLDASEVTEVEKAVPVEAQVPKNPVNQAKGAPTVFDLQKVAATEVKRGAKVATIDGVAEVTSVRDQLITVKYRAVDGYHFVRDWTLKTSIGVSVKGLTAYDVSVGDEVFMADVKFLMRDVEGKVVRSEESFKGRGKVVGITPEGKVFVKVYRKFIDTMKFPFRVLLGKHIFNYIIVSPSDVRVVKKVQLQSKDIARLQQLE